MYCRLLALPRIFADCREKADVFRANGFEIIAGDDGAALLTAVPFSRNTTFSAADVLELVSLLNDGDAAPLPMSRSASDSASDTIVRPSKCACYLRCAACPACLHAQGFHRVSKTGKADDAAHLMQRAYCRVRAMLAMRACRSSVMVGTALDEPVMARILSHLADLHAPWNCPHGRPTMRHLCKLP